MKVVRKNKTQNRRYIKLGFVYCVAIICVIISTVLVMSLDFTVEVLNVEKDKINLELIGNEFQTLSINSDYFDDGIKMTVNDEEINIDDVDYQITNNIDSNIIGKYQVNYEVKYDNDIYKITRNVEVVDDVLPNIVVYNQAISKKTCGNIVKNNLNFYAFDNYDGVITEKVVVEEIESNYKLSVSDSSGNYTEIYVPINYETNNPIITLNGNLIVYVPLNTEYKDGGAEVYDICGNKTTMNVTVTNNVNTTVPGTYKVEYRVEGYDAYAERIVIVYEKKDSVTIENNQNKVVYLTFDDGPGKYTEELLNILNKYNVKATFFVTNQFKNYTHLIEREYKDGHVVGVHTLTHKWNIYRSLENYMKDFNEMNAIIESYTGERSIIFRYPGGGSNTISRGQSTGIMKASVSRMNELGYVYFDWNVDSGDAAGASSLEIYNNVIEGISKRNYSVVLMHDIKKNTLDVIENIIVYALENGYTFEVLSINSPTVHHHVNN